MNRPSPILWLAVILILLLPTAAGRIFLDLAGGLILLLFALPFVLGGAGWIGWKILKNQMITCDVCGASTLAKTSQCPVCGSKINGFQEEESIDSIPASSATIDINAEEAE